MPDARSRSTPVLDTTPEERLLGLIAWFSDKPLNNEQRDVVTVCHALDAVRTLHAGAHWCGPSDPIESNESEFYLDSCPTLHAIQAVENTDYPPSTDSDDQGDNA